MIELKGVGKSIIDVIEKQVALHQSDEALVLENGISYTYAALDAIATELSRHIAHCISQLGDLDMGDNNTPLVTVIMNRGVGIAATFLAILKAGCAYVPVDPSFPPNRQSYIMKQSRSHLLIIDPENMLLAQSLGVDMPPTLVVDGGTGAPSPEHAPLFPLPEDGFAAADAKLLVDRAAAQERPQGGLAYILFTSGSTGNPKGCVAHNQSCLSQLQAFGAQLSVKAPKPGDSRSHRVLGLATFSFDISVLELFLPLVHGTTSLMAFSSTQRDSFRLKEILDTMQIDVMQATPTTYEMLLAVGWKGRDDIQLLVGGEAFRPSLLPLVQNCHSTFNIYGPTETTMWASTYLVPKDIQTLNPTVHGVSCGQPLPGVKFYIANKEDYTQLVNGDDVEGELVIGGVGANSGRYIHALDLTSAVFHPNPYGDPGRIYQSGDIFRRIRFQYRNEDGSIVDSYNHIFVSRNDDQVKIDGFRIELEEIERVFLHSAPKKSIDVCVAIVRNKKLILYIKPKSAKKTDSVIDSNDLHMSQTQIEEMKTQAAKSLMYYMMPLHYITVQSFPVTPGFKIDRKALPDPPEWAELAAISNVTDEAENSCNNIKEKLPCGVNVVRSHAGYWDPENHPDSIDSDEEDNTEGKPLSMLQHVIAMVYRARGVRPSANSNFVSIGVDSLGAIFFLTLLSESLGGVRIKPQEMFAQGVTLESFSKQLAAKLIVENLSLLQELHITADIPNIDEKSDAAFDINNVTTPGDVVIDAYNDVENGCSCVNTFSLSNLRNLQSRICGADSASAVQNAQDENAVMSADTQISMRKEDEEILRIKQERDRIGSAWAYESSFEDEYSNICAANLPMLDGLRCVFTFIVLFDHFWVNTSLELDNRALGSSISMFLLVTGWGTALILREPEKLRFHTVTRWFKKDTSSAAEEQVHGYLVLRRTPFNWKSFLLTRFVGLFPVMWLALLLVTPWWILQDKQRREQTEVYYSLSPDVRPKMDPMDLTINGYVQSTNGIICTGLYVTGLNAFYRPQCRMYGPNMLLFASIIWGLFLLWIIPKIVWVWLQEKLMRWGLQNNSSENDVTKKDDMESGLSNIIVGVPNTDSVHSAKCKTIIHNNIPAEYRAIDSIFDSTGDSLFCQLPSINALAVHSHKEYFRALFFRMTYNRPNGFRELICFTAGAMFIMSVLMAFRAPWQMKNSVKFVPDFLAGFMGAAIAECYCYARFVARKRDIQGSAFRAWFGIDLKTLTETASDIKSQRLRTVLDFCQTYLSDFSWMLFFFILSDATLTLRNATSGVGLVGAYKFIEWIWIELLVLLLLFSYFAQEKATSNSFSRYLLSTRFSAAIGHSSYVIYLLQRPGIDIWGPSFSYFFQTGIWKWNNGTPHWFEWTPNIWKVCGIAVLLFCCWLIQLYFQDVLVARSFMWAQKKWNTYWEVNKGTDESQPRSIELPNISPSI